jgi:hypothetical protein
MATVFALVAAVGGLLYTGLIIYRLWFHPLAKFPGPRLAAATNWYEAYYELLHKGGSQYSSMIRDMHAKYGPIVRITPEEISINDAEFHDELYAPQPEIRNRHPSASSSLGTTKGSFSTGDHHLHRNRRTAYSPFFSSANILACEPVMKNNVTELCDIVRENEGKQPDLRTYFAALSFDTFYTWAFGTPLNLLRDQAHADLCNKSVEILVTSPPVYKIFPSAMKVARQIPQAILRRLSRHVAWVFDVHQVRAIHGSVGWQMLIL